MSNAAKEARDKLWGRIRRTPDMSTAAVIISGYLITEDAGSSETGAPVDATTAAATATPKARGSHDLFKERVAPLGDKDIDDSESEYESPADENNEDDGDLSLMIEEKGDEEQKDLSRWFGNAPDVYNALP